MTLFGNCYVVLSNAKTYLADHGVGVDLTHIRPAILLPYASNMKMPFGMARMCHKDPGIMCNNMCVNGLNCL